MVEHALVMIQGIKLKLNFMVKMWVQNKQAEIMSWMQISLAALQTILSMIKDMWNLLK